MMLNRVSLNTIGLNRIGLNRIGKPSRGSSSGSDRPYIDPEVLASLKAVCICYGKSNDDPDRAVVKNLVDSDNPFVISNAAYTEGSGYADKGSPYYGAFVTDGIEDLITSTKTVQEMLGGSNEITVVSLITHISGTGKYNIIGDGGIQVSDYSGQTFMAGTSSSGEKIVELGDKEKLQAVQYTTFDSKLTIGLEDSSYAYYGTFVFNKENVPVDWIHQVIAYFNLDRTLNPDILCNTIKQGITNENHAEFGDKLIDFSGNGRDIQLNNIAWKGGSGIAAKQYETFKDWTSEYSSTSIIKQIDEFTRIVESTTNGYWVSRIRRDSDLNKVYDAINVYLYQDNNFLVHECKYEVDGIKYSIPINESVGKGYHKLEMYTKDRYTELPENAENIVLSEWYFPKSTKGSIKYSVIPSYKGGILLDGINDFGKVTGMPIYKDYTFIIDYERISYTSSEVWTASVVSKAHTVGQGGFLLMLANREVELSRQSNSFGSTTTFNRDDFTRTLLYQSKYKCGDVNLTVGEGIDGDTLWLGTLRDNDFRFFNGAIYSLMSFPYSMSEFLIERQLKKHKLGTLYPDMVEFRPIVKSNLPYSSISYSVNPGEYISVDSMVTITVTLPNTSDKLMEVSCNAISDISISGDNGVYEITGKVVKSPQKINLVISSYLTMLSNLTLISNETLIKNE